MQHSTGILSTRGRGRGSWKEGQEVTELRRPRTTSNVLGGQFSQVPDAKAGGDNMKSFAHKTSDKKTETVKTSRLSADAKEFFPKDYIAEKNEAAGGEATNCSSGYLSSSYLAQIIHDLNLNPGLYNSYIGTLTDLLLHESGDHNIYQNVVNTIVEKSIALPNFRYTGARLLCHFRNSLPNGLQHDFRTCLLRKCQEENDSVVGNKPDSVRVQGFAFFLAELFIQMEVTVGADDRIKVLGSALYNVLAILLRSPSFESIKCICQVLKLTGLALDEQDTQVMDAVFDTLFKIQQSSTETRIRNLISSVIRLRQNAWREPQTSNQTHKEHMEEKVVQSFYLTDGGVLSAEENRFLEENALVSSEESEYSGKSSWSAVESEEDEEGFDEAYEKFLEFSNQTKKSS